MVLWDTSRTVTTNQRYLYYRLLSYIQEAGPERRSVIEPALHYYFVSGELFSNAISRLRKDGFLEIIESENPELKLTDKGKKTDAKYFYLRGVIKDTAVNNILIALADSQTFSESIDENLILNDFKLNMRRSEIENAFEIIADTLPNIAHIDNMEGNYYKMLGLYDSGKIIDLIEYIERGGYRDKRNYYKIILDWTPHAIAIIAVLVAVFHARHQDAQYSERDIYYEKKFDSIRTEAKLLMQKLEAHTDSKALHQNEKDLPDTSNKTSSDPAPR